MKWCFESGNKLFWFPDQSLLIKMKWKNNFRNLCKFIKKKKCNHHIGIGLAVVIALSCLGDDSESYTLIGVWGFCDSSLHTVSSCRWLDGDCCWMVTSRSLRWSSTWFNQCSSEATQTCPMSHSCVVLGCYCLGSWTCSSDKLVGNLPVAPFNSWRSYFNKMINLWLFVNSEFSLPSVYHYHLLKYILLFVWCYNSYTFDYKLKRPATLMKV